MASELLMRGELEEMVPTNIRLGGYYFITQARRWNETSIATLRKWLLQTFPDNQAITNE